MGDELIDTLWNVNTTYDVEDKETTWRINRYIMECKCENNPLAERTTRGINRYIMECKFNNSPFLRGFCWN